MVFNLLLTEYVAMLHNKTMNGPCEWPRLRLNSIIFNSIFRSSELRMRRNFLLLLDLIIYFYCHLTVDGDYSLWVWWMLAHCSYEIHVNCSSIFFMFSLWNAKESLWQNHDSPFRVLRLCGSGFAIDRFHGIPHLVVVFGCIQHIHFGFIRNENKRWIKMMFVTRHTEHISWIDE